MSNVIRLFKHGIDKKYEQVLSTMDNKELLEEMVRFQESRNKIGKLTLKIISRGIPLFAALEKNAKTEALKTMAGSYKVFLQCELHILNKF